MLASGSACGAGLQNACGNAPQAKEPAARRASASRLAKCRPGEARETEKTCKITCRNTLATPTFRRATNSGRRTISQFNELTPTIPKARAGQANL